jgi:hypothetical protein
MLLSHITILLNKMRYRLYNIQYLYSDNLKIFIIVQTFRNFSDERLDNLQDIESIVVQKGRS